MTSNVRSLKFAMAVVLTAVGAAVSPVLADAEADRAEVARLDTAYQAAVKANDVATMDRILHPDFTLVIGVGKTFDKSALLASARDEIASYAHQEEIEGTQTVRLFGEDTAVVTALLWIAGTPKGGGEPFDYKLWFSDTYVRTPEGWRYAFGQAAQRLAP